MTVLEFELFGTFSDPTRIVSYGDGVVLRVAAFAYRVSVVAFDGLRASSESEELRLFPLDELLGLELPATQRPVFECLLSGEPTPFLL